MTKQVSNKSVSVNVAKATRNSRKDLTAAREVKAATKVTAVYEATTDVVKEVPNSLSKGYSMEGNIVKVKGYSFNTETNELIRKGKVVLNIMPRFHEEVLAVANTIGNEMLASLCVSKVVDKMTDEERKAKSKERRAARRELVKQALENFNAKVNGAEIV